MEEDALIFDFGRYLKGVVIQREGGGTNSMIYDIKNILSYIFVVLDMKRLLSGDVFVECFL